MIHHTATPCPSILTRRHWRRAGSMKDSTGWHLFYTSPHITSTIDRVAINAKVVPTGSVADSSTKMLGISCGGSVHLWRISEDGSKSDVGGWKSLCLFS